MIVANNENGNFWLYIVGYLVIAYWQEFWPYRATFIPTIGYYVGESLDYASGTPVHDKDDCLLAARLMAAAKGFSRTPEVFCRKLDYWGRYVDNVK